MPFIVATYVYASSGPILKIRLPRAEKIIPPRLTPVLAKCEYIAKLPPFILNFTFILKKPVLNPLLLFILLLSYIG